MRTLLLSAAALVLTSLAAAPSRAEWTRQTVHTYFESPFVDPYAVYGYAVSSRYYYGLDYVPPPPSHPYARFTQPLRNYYIYTPDRTTTRPALLYAERYAAPELRGTRERNRRETPETHELRTR